MASAVRVRFAPAPTGLLHIGNARTALYNYLFARKEKGTFILRIEDTDAERSTEASIEAILEDLRWLGIDWEEGPDVGGPRGPYRQSMRVSLYRDYAEQLFREGKVYKCFCPPERLEALRKEQLSKGVMPRYDGRCRTLTKEEILKRESEGDRPVLRYRVERGTIVFEDLLHGRMSFDASGIGDFILVRSDGMAAYNFACVIDDHLMEISHVIRGDDHLSNTPRQILIYRAFGWQPPLFAHHPLILGQDRSPLSKRHGATAVSQYREEGFLPEALLNYLVLLGWSGPSKEEILSIEQIVTAFNISGLSRNAPIHSRKKLEWLNSHYIRRMSPEQLAFHLLPYLEKAGIDLKSLDQTFLGRVCHLLRENLFLLSQVEDYLGIFFDKKFAFDEEAKALLSSADKGDLLRTVFQAIQDWPEISEVTVSSLFRHLEEVTGQKGKGLYGLLRAAITGKMKGPELAKILPLLQKESILKRLQRAMELTRHGDSNL
ncbi:MAG: glutamate--tRNA ligase [Desulfobacterota bacterium]|nr:glutamate--tRNA ligase [Thermodesulfobacteriota bacterium]